MDNALILDEKTLRRIPPFFLFIFILLLGFPAIALHYFGSITNELKSNSGIETLIVEAELRDYFQQLLLQWTAFLLSALTVLLAFTQYRLTNDKIALIIGSSLLFSGTTETLHTLVFDQLADKNLIWTFANIGSGLILSLGLVWFLTHDHANKARTITVAAMNLLLASIAFMFVYYLTFTKHPMVPWQTTFGEKPYHLLYLLIYLFVSIILYPMCNKKHPTIITNCILYIALTQMSIALYFLVLSNTAYEEAYNIAYFLKIIVYFIPFSCFIINYVFSYRSILHRQNTLQANQEKLQYIAARDPLTELYNRREFEYLLDKTIANSQRTFDAFALFLIDIDNFKLTNDSLGHMQGDHFLKTFADKLVSLTRKGDILSRIGGDEFTLITSTLKSSFSAERLAERLIQGLNYPIDKTPLIATVSIGIALYPLNGLTTEELLKNADLAMYNAKKAGKNTYRFYTTELNSKENKNIDIQPQLRETVEKFERLFR